MAKGMREYLANKNGETPTALSALWFYYAERKVDGDIADDAGSTMTTGMNVLHDQGAATDVTWPYDITKFADAPPAAADATAASWKVKTTTQLATLADIKTASACTTPSATSRRTALCPTRRQTKACSAATPC
jgi:hypothetical protein